MTASTEGTETRDRLLRAAGEVFAARDFRDATVRDIVERAEANIASVNYHFGGKAELYAAVLDAACERLAAAMAVPTEALIAGEPSARLARFLRAFLSRLMEERADSWEFRLLARAVEEEVVSPQALVAPVHAHLVGLSREIEPALSAEVADLCAGSVLAQCLHFRHARPFLALPQGEAGTALLADHILEFTLGGLHRRTSPKESM